MNMSNTIACPVCSTPIAYDVYALLAGQKFSCPKCSAQLCLAAESHSVVEKTVKKYEALKSSAGRPV